MSKAYGRVEVTSRAEWREWLAGHHAELPGIWLVTYKKAAGDRYVPYADLVEEALCFGWIDGQAQGLDELRSMLLMTPRKKGSGWSRPNKERIERLTAAGVIEPAGQAAIDRAVADGSWTKLDAVENLEEPHELAIALDASPDARKHWDAFPRSPKRAALEWLSQAKRPETRANRIAGIVASAARNERPR